MSSKINTTKPSMATRSKRRVTVSSGQNDAKAKSEQDMDIVVEVRTPKSLPKPALAPTTPIVPNRKRAYPRSELNSAGLQPVRLIFDAKNKSWIEEESNPSDDNFVVAVSDESETQRSVRRRLDNNQSDRFRSAQEALDRAAFGSSPNLSPIRSTSFRPGYWENDRSVTPVLRSPPKIALRQAIIKFEDGLQILKAIYGNMEAEDRDNASSDDVESDDIRVD